MTGCRQIRNMEGAKQNTEYAIMYPYACCNKFRNDIHMFSFCPRPNLGQQSNASRDIEVPYSLNISIQNIAAS